MRREKFITITSDNEPGKPENRDKGKTFYIREMGAVQAERWAMRALIAVSGPGASVPNKAGLASLANAKFSLLTMLGNIKWEVAQPLLDEMMACVQRKESPTCIRTLVEEDIDEVTTLLQLRKEVLELHLGFSLAEKFQTLVVEPPAADSALPTT
jgi:hypothetical protein